MMSWKRLTEQPRIGQKVKSVAMLPDGHGLQGHSLWVGVVCGHLDVDLCQVTWDHAIDGPYLDGQPTQWRWRDLYSEDLLGYTHESF